MERQRPTLGVRFTVEVSVKRESTVYLFFLLIILQLSDLGIEIEEHDGGIFVKEVQQHGCVAVHGKLAHLWCMVVDACYTCEKGHSQEPIKFDGLLALIKLNCTKYACVTH